MLDILSTASNDRHPPKLPCSEDQSLSFELETARLCSLPHPRAWVAEQTFVELLKHRRHDFAHLAEEDFRRSRYMMNRFHDQDIQRGKKGDCGEAQWGARGLKSEQVGVMSLRRGAD